jgi:ATP-dependent helicase/nuclease subunit B
MGTARFIIGLAGSGKTTRLIGEIADALRADPLGPPILLLVPDQATLLYERMAADASDTGGYLRLAVLTFRELTERLLAEAGGSAIPEVTPLGRRILIGRLLRRLQPELTFYRSTARQPGLANQLDAAFAEIEHSGATLDDLTYLAADIELQSPQSPLPAKLRDVRLLMAEYEKLLGSDRLDQHRRQRRALEAAGLSRMLKSSRLYVDGFYELTRSEREMLTTVARAGCPVTVALTLDPAETSPARQQIVLDDDHPFRTTTHTFRRLLQSMTSAGVTCSTDVCPTAPRFPTSPADLLHLQKQFLSTRPGSAQAAGALRLVEAPTPRTEVDAAARQIIDWLAQGMRMRDILVLCRDVDVYLRHLEASFDEHRLAYFIDRQNPASHHPLVRSVRAMSQVALSQWQPDSVMELIKAGLVGIDADTCDAVENYIIAHRIRGVEAWNTPWAFRLRRTDDDEAVRVVQEETDRINAARVTLVEGLAPLMDCDDSRHCSATQWCQQLCRSLELLRVDQALAGRIVDAQGRSDPDAAARHHEVWAELITLLDQLATVLGDEPLSLREFSEVLDVALERFVLAITPPTIDQVLVGGVERTRTSTVRACIVLGLSEGRFPRRHDETDVLTDDDRRLLDERKIEVRAGARVAQLSEPFLAYLALTRASDRLTVMRCTTDDEGRRLAPSLYWTQIRSIFPGLEVEDESCAPRESCLATPRQLVEALVHTNLKSTEPPSTAMRELSGFVQASDHPQLVSLRDAVERARRYDNHATLNPDLAAKLYPSPLRTSATGLETYAACPFKHFAQHGLRLTTRDDVHVTPMHLGTAYHRVLDQLVRQTIAERQDLASPLADIASRLHRLGEQATQSLREELWLSPGRTQHLLDAMKRTLNDVVETQRLTLALGSMRPHRTELAFGFDDSAPALKLPTPRGRQVELRGKIDRVDIVRFADHLAATVIDYKLSAKRPELDRLYFGLNLQLVSYLLVVLAIGEELGTDLNVKPAAALYVKLARHITSVAHPSQALTPPDEDFFLNTANKARGFIDEHYVDALDPNNVRSKAYSLVKSSEPIEGVKKDVVEHDAFQSLIRWTRLKLGQLADQIMSGRIDVMPYKLDTNTPCPTCPYRSVCRLDLRFNRYFYIERLKDERMKQIVKEAPQ